jgi:hypothetical protein
MAHKHVSKPVPDGLSTNTNTATRMHKFMINNCVLDRLIVPADNNQARECHAAQKRVKACS